MCRRCNDTTQESSLPISTRSSKQYSPSYWSFYWWSSFIYQFICCYVCLLFSSLIHRWFAIGSYVISCIIAIFVLPESLPMLLERKKILNNLKEQNLPREAYEEQKKRLLYQLTVQGECCE